MKLNLGFLGAGTVGTGAIRGLYKQLDEFKESSGIELVIEKVVSRDSEKYFFNYPHSTDIDSVINDSTIDIVVSLMGGYEEYNAIKKALENGKHVVTANKAVIDKYGVELNQLGIDNNVHLAFEASVAGGIPIINNIKRDMIGNDTKNIIDILNGTTNYILYHMANDGWSYDKALKSAQDLRFAERNPSFDVEGLDAAQKLAILYSIAFDCKVTQDQIFTQGIRDITLEDIKYAADFGYVIKLLGIGKDRNGKAELRLHPTLIPFDHPLASVAEEKNSVLLEGDGNISFEGEGAGMYPTGSSVVSDIKNLALMIGKNQPPVRYLYDRDVECIGIEDVVSRFYLRFSALDQPGTLAKITKSFADNDVSISGVLQSERKKGRKVPLVITTWPTTFARIKDSLLYLPGGTEKESLIFLGLEDHIENPIEIYIQEDSRGLIENYLGPKDFELYKGNILKTTITTGELGRLKGDVILGPIKRYKNIKDPEKRSYPSLEFGAGDEKTLITSLPEEHVHSLGGKTRVERGEKLIRIETEKNPRDHSYFDPVVEIYKRLLDVTWINKPVVLYFRK